MSPMRILIIGAGAIAHHHAAAARLLPGAAILAADPSPEACAKFAEAFPEAQLFDSPETMLSAAPAGPDDIVVVAVPPWLHAPLAIKALEAGFHVLCEKPLGRSLAEVDEILSTAARAGRMVGDCAVRFNGQPAMTRAREIIATGDLGRLNLARMVNRNPRMRPGIEYQPVSRWFLNREKAGGGVLLDWSVYDLGMLFDVLQPVAVKVASAWVGGVAGRDDPPEFPVEVESHVAAMLQLGLPDGSRLPLLYERANGVNGPALYELSVEGTKGGLSWQWLPPYEDGKTGVTRFVDRDGKVEPEVEAVDMGTHPHYHHVPLLSLAARIAGRPSVALEEARIRFNFATIAAIYQTAETGQSVRVTA
jgi:predicted dehydrogenase